MQEDRGFCCSRKSHKMERFLEICLLLLLYEEVGYGYGLIEKLTFFGFSEEELNVSTLYKTLRKMEQEKSVTSLWEEGSAGPRKRVYKITSAGKEELNRWIQILKVRRTGIDKVIDIYGKLDFKDGAEGKNETTAD